MKVRAIIFAYDRSAMLLNLLRQLRGSGKFDSIVVYDDASTFDASEHVQLCTEYWRNDQNQGKRNFWKQWARALEYCKENPADMFVFMPDDFQNLDIDLAVFLHKSIVGGSGKYAPGQKPYAFNIINCGRTACWTPMHKHSKNVGGVKVSGVGFVDCGFFCNPSALGVLNYNIQEVPASWFDSPAKSSGVGMQLSKRFYTAGVSMYQPVKSLAYHGDHESKMHPHERKRNPLISK